MSREDWKRCDQHQSPTSASLLHVRCRSWRSVKRTKRKVSLSVGYPILKPGFPKDQWEIWRLRWSQWCGVSVFWCLCSLLTVKNSAGLEQIDILCPFCWFIGWCHVLRKIRLDVWFYLTVRANDVQSLCDARHENYPFSKTLQLSLASSFCLVLCTMMPYKITWLGQKTFGVFIYER